MKISLAIKKIAFPFFLLFLFVSWKDSAEINSKIKNDSVSTVATKDTVKKWNAVASAAQVKFSIGGPFGTVHGSLSGLKSTILFDEDNLAASTISASVDSRSISTGIGMRNRDLQKEKYLNTDKYPSFSFRSENIQKSGTGYKAIGSLTIKGVTKPVEIPFSFSEKGNAGVFKGRFTIRRQDYGVGSAGGSIGSTVTIDLEVPVKK